MEIKNYDFKGKKAIVRVDFNVPIQDGKITDDTRIRGAVPTLKLILEKGGALIIMSHMGKPKGKKKPELSLGQITGAVAAALGVKEVKFAADDSWTKNWGSEDFPMGFGVDNGKNVKVTQKGKYRVLFNDVTGFYSFMKLPKD